MEGSVLFSDFFVMMILATIMLGVGIRLSGLLVELVGLLVRIGAIIFLLLVVYLLFSNLSYV